MENTNLRIICKNCDGNGYNIQIEPACCNSCNEDGTCCGLPIQEQVQVKCKCDNGFIPPKQTL